MKNKSEKLSAKSAKAAKSAPLAHDKLASGQVAPYSPTLGKTGEELQSKQLGNENENETRNTLANYLQYADELSRQEYSHDAIVARREVLGELEELNGLLIICWFLMSKKSFVNGHRLSDKGLVELLTRFMIIERNDKRFRTVEEIENVYKIADSKVFAYTEHFGTKDDSGLSSFTNIAFVDLVYAFVDIRKGSCDPISFFYYIMNQLWGLPNDTQQKGVDISVLPMRQIRGLGAFQVNDLLFIKLAVAGRKSWYPMLKEETEAEAAKLEAIEMARESAQQVDTTQDGESATSKVESPGSSLVKDRFLARRAGTLFQARGRSDYETISAMLRLSGTRGLEGNIANNSMDTDSEDEDQDDTWSECSMFDEDDIIWLEGTMKGSKADDEKAIEIQKQCDDMRKHLKNKNRTKKFFWEMTKSWKNFLAVAKAEFAKLKALELEKGEDYRQKMRGFKFRLTNMQKDSEEQDKRRRRLAKKARAAEKRRQERLKAMMSEREARHAAGNYTSDEEDDDNGESHLQDLPPAMRKYSEQHDLKEEITPQPSPTNRVKFEFQVSLPSNTNDESSPTQEGENDANLAIGGKKLGSQVRTEDSSHAEEMRIEVKSPGKRRTLLSRIGNLFGGASDAPVSPH
jgi:hypothetical protein